MKLISYIINVSLAVFLSMFIIILLISVLNEIEYDKIFATFFTISIMIIIIFSCILNMKLVINSRLKLSIMFFLNYTSIIILYFAYDNEVKSYSPYSKMWAIIAIWLLIGFVLSFLGKVGSAKATLPD